MKRIQINPRARKQVLGGHPWIFSGAIRDVEGDPGPADSVAVHCGDEFLGCGLYSPQSQIRVRLYSRKRHECDRPYLRQALLAARNRRRLLLSRQTTCYRLVNSEGDSLPGLCIDVYGNIAVLQLTTAPMDTRRRMILELLLEMGFASVVERSDASVRSAEGLEPQRGLLHGSLPDPLLVQENGLFFQVDPQEGQKTGFFLDQRDNRQLLGSLAKGAEVLNGFCYTGGFSLAALRGGAQYVKSIDISGSALHMLRRNLQHNQLEQAHHVMEKADMFEALRDEDSEFQIVVLDPPPFVKNASSVPKAMRGYKDINRLALQRVRSGGLLMSFSCSGHIDMNRFEEALRWAAMDSGRQVQLLRRLGPGSDHPRLLGHPEGEYLKGLLLQVV